MLGERTGSGLEACICRKDTRDRLNEYNVIHHPAENGESAWSECFLETIDEPFQISVSQINPPAKTNRKKREEKGWKCVYKIDGKAVANIAWHQDIKEDSMRGLYEKDEDNGKLYFASLKFAPLATTDDPSKITIDKDKLNELGMIEITLQGGNFTPIGAREHTGYSYKTDVADEKSKKFSYTVEKSDKQEVKNTATVRYDFQHTIHSMKDYRFIFKYRPRAVLIQSGIIDEPTPPPEVNTNPPRRKRRSSAFSDAILISDDEDVKPNLERKRVKYLEDQVKKLSSELKHLKNGGKSKIDAVDLTLDDD